jgi:hypothetical protein
MPSQADDVALRYLPLYVSALLLLLPPCETLSCLKNFTGRIFGAIPEFDGGMRQRRGGINS